MVGGKLVEHVRTGMTALFSDGKQLGTVTQVHTRDTDTYLEVTPRGNLWKPWQLMVKLQRLFLPGNTVTDVAGKYVRVAMDAKTAKGCTWRPTWLPHEDDPAPYHMIGGGSG